jgi:hypothetical protein
MLIGIASPLKGDIEGSNPSLQSKNAKTASALNVSGQMLDAIANLVLSKSARFRYVVWRSFIGA